MFITYTRVPHVSPCLDVLWTGRRIPVHSHTACFTGRLVSFLERGLGREDGKGLDFRPFEMLVGISSYMSCAEFALSTYTK